MMHVENVRLRKPTPGPDQPGSPKEALHANPTEVVVIGTYTTRHAAREAAKRVNLNQRAKDWPNDTYYAAWAFNEETVQWELWIGLREHMPEGWRRFVDGDGRRTRRRPNQTDDGEPSTERE